MEMTPLGSCGRRGQGSVDQLMGCACCGSPSGSEALVSQPPVVVAIRAPAVDHDGQDDRRDPGDEDEEVASPCLPRAELVDEVRLDLVDLLASDGSPGDHEHEDIQR